MSAVRWSRLATLAVAALTVSVPVFAQTMAQSTAQPAAPKYESAFTGYQPYRDEKPANWREVNDTMGALGGHNAHLREVAKSVAAAGTVLEIDRAANRVRIESDGVKALGWPAGVTFWLLKSPSLADQIKPGEKVAFTLEREGDAYRITGFGGSPPPARPREKAADPHAGHNMAAPKAATPPAPQAAQPAAPKAPHDMKNMGGMK